MSVTREHRLIAITPPEDIPNETPFTHQILAGGLLDTLHVRKPSYSPVQMRKYLTVLCNEGWGERLVLHSCFECAAEFPVRGVHLNEEAKRHPEVARGVRKVSLAVHEPSELAEIPAGAYEYVLASPFFPSLSKTGYLPRYSLAEWGAAIAVSSCRVVALGGVLPQYLSKIWNLGCGGAAFLGYLWQAKTKEELAEFLNKLKEYAHE